MEDGVVIDAKSKECRFRGFVYKNHTLAAYMI